MARKSALDARVERYINFATARFQDAEPPAERGLLVTNLPYGERIGSGEARPARAVRGDRRHAEAELRRLARGAARGRRLALQGHRPQAVRPIR